MAGHGSPSRKEAQLVAGEWGEWAVSQGGGSRWTHEAWQSWEKAWGLFEELQGGPAWRG